MEIINKRREIRQVSFMGQENSKNPKNSSNDPNLEEIKDLYDFMCSEGLDELEISRRDFSVKMVRNTGKYVRIQESLPPAEAEPKKILGQPETLPNGQCIRAPLTGIFYRAPSPKSSPFVNEGDRVAPGATMCILEAMKVMNEIKAEKPCEIIKIAAENGKMVKTGDVIFVIR